MNRLFAAILLFSVSCCAQAQTSPQQIYNVKDYGLVADFSFATGTGTDNTAALNALIASIPSGGTIYFPLGAYGFAGTINVNKSNLNFLGSSNSTGNGWFYMGTGSANFVDVQSAQFTTFKGFSIATLVPIWSGYLTTVRNSTGSDPSNTIFEKMDFFAPNNANASLMLLNTAIETTILDSRFVGGVNGIVGALPGSYSNVFRMEGGHFASQSNAPVSFGGNGWTFNSVAFEARSDGKMVAYNGSSAIPSQSLSFINCWFGDATVNGGTTVSVWGVGFTFTGNTMSGNGPVAGNIAIGLNNTKAANITGNQITFYDTAINYANPMNQGGLITANAYHGVNRFEANIGNKDSSVTNVGNTAY